MASDLGLRFAHRRYEPMPDFQKELLLSCCSDADIKVAGGSKRIDPMLKLYVGCPVMISDNIDVEHSIANGTMLTFKSVKLKKGIEDCSIVNINGYFVRCVEASTLDHVEVILEGNPSGQGIRRIELCTRIAKGKFSDPGSIIEGRREIHTRKEKRLQLSQFPFNVANARTVHKLQGKSLEKLLISNWSYTVNWVYVVLSRVRTLNKLFIYLKCQILLQN